MWQSACAQAVRLCTACPALHIAQPHPLTHTARTPSPTEQASGCTHLLRDGAGVCWVLGGRRGRPGLCVLQLALQGARGWRAARRRSRGRRRGAGAQLRHWLAEGAVVSHVRVPGDPSSRWPVRALVLVRLVLARSAVRLACRIVRLAVRLPVRGRGPRRRRPRARGGVAQLLLRVAEQGRAVRQRSGPAAGTRC